MKLDILAVGAHPDDVEIGCSGTLLKHAGAGYAIGVVDLTEGELGTRGSVEMRREEAAKSADILGLSVRHNLGLEDGFIRNDRPSQMRLVELIRAHSPRIVLANALKDRHPDHGHGAELVRDACFLSGLRRIVTERDGTTQEPWRPQSVYHYIQAQYLEPSFIVDISGCLEEKMQAILAYKSQFFDPESAEPETFISDAGFLDFIRGRAVAFGKLIGAEHGEGFVAEMIPGVRDLTHLL